MRKSLSLIYEFFVLPILAFVVFPVLILLSDIVAISRKGRGT